MPIIDLDSATYERLRLVAAALERSETATVAHLLERLEKSRPAVSDLARYEAIYVVYKGNRVDAEFDRETDAVTITSGPLAGSTHEKPSPAARAVVGLLAPTVNPHRNGWSFWLVTASGEPLQSLRRARR